MDKRKLYSIGLSSALILQTVGAPLLTHATEADPSTEPTVLEEHKEQDDQGNSITRTLTTIPFEVERVDNPNLLEGQEIVRQKGEEGVLETITRQEIRLGKPYGEPSVVENELKAARNEIIEVGTGVERETPFKVDHFADETLPFGEEFVKEKGHYGRSVGDRVILEPIKRVIHVGNLRVEESTIRFNTQYVENPDLPKGTENVIQEGVHGQIRHEHRYDVDINTGDLSETYQTTDVTVTEMVPEIIEIGVGEAGEVHYNIIRIPNPTLKPGEEIVIQDGVMGEKWNNTITKEPIDMIIEYGPDIKAAVPHNIEQHENSNLTGNETNVIQEGEDGESINGNVVKDPKPTIIETAPEVREETPYKTTRRANIELEEGEERVAVPGTPGVLVNGQVLKSAIDEVVEYGPKRIPFEKETQEDPLLNEGEKKVIQAGVEGLVDEEGHVIRPALNEITVVGTRKVEAPVESENTDKKESEEQPSENTSEDKDIVSNDETDKDDNTTDKQDENKVILNRDGGYVIGKDVPAGIADIRLVEVDGKFGTGNVVVRTKDDRLAFNEAVNNLNAAFSDVRLEEGGSVSISSSSRQIVLELTYTGEITDKAEEDLPDGINANKNPNIDSGVAGPQVDVQVTETEDVQEDKDDKVISAPQKTQSTHQVDTQLKEDPAKSSSTKSSTESKTEEVKKDETKQTAVDSTKPDVKPDVKTGVEDVATNPTIMTTIGVMLGGFLSAIGVKIGQGKNKED